MCLVKLEATEKEGRKVDSGMRVLALSGVICTTECASLLCSEASPRGVVYVHYPNQI